MEFGTDGKASYVAKAGEVLHVPKNTIHPRANVRIYPMPVISRLCCVCCFLDKIAFLLLCGS